MSTAYYDIGERGAGPPPFPYRGTSAPRSGHVRPVNLNRYTTRVYTREGANLDHHNFAMDNVYYNLIFVM